MLPAVFYVELRKVGNSWVLTMPKEIVDGNQWKKGDTFAISSIDDTVTIKKVRPEY